MYRSVLVPLDGSRFGEEAVSTAVGLALKGAEAVHLVTVLEPARFGDSDDEDVRRKTEAAAQAYLSDVADRIAGRTSALDVSLTVLPPGKPAVALAKHVHATQAGLVVMTSHGRGPLSRVWLGSTTDRLLQLHDGPRPIMVVRPSEGGAPEIPDTPLSIQRVLVPLDGSPESELALEDVPRLADEGAQITLFRALAPYIGGAYPLLPREEGQDRKQERKNQDARARLERSAERLREVGYQVKVRTTAAVQPGAAILEEANRSGADLIAMATQKKSSGFRGTLGSVADKVIRGAECPVLLVRRPDEDAAAG